MCRFGAVLPNNMKPKILVLGGASYDEIIHLDKLPNGQAETLFAKKQYHTIGSTGVGKALALKKLGFEVAFVALVGQDEDGDKIKHKMASEGIDFYPLESETTERHTNLMNSDGKRISIFTTYAMPAGFDPEEYRFLIEKADAIILNIKPYCKAFLPILKETTKPIYCDIHDYDGVEEYHQVFIEVSSYIIMSSERINEVSAYVKKLLAAGKRWVLVTKGNKGATLYTKNKMFNHQPAPINIVDSNGAGDNFFAGFLYGYLHQFNFEKSLCSGQIVAETCLLSEDIVSEKLNQALLRKKMLEIGK